MATKSAGFVDPLFSVHLPFSLVGYVPSIRPEHYAVTLLSAGQSENSSNVRRNLAVERNQREARRVTRPGGKLFIRFPWSKTG